ncbi:hypothetical protein THSYN_14035 [Candidatus Thiodictyon syntrophicum]|jgi:hypothetical protein|uniref:Peptidase C14 caspase catalytic subunit p20 n=1 Tax=Candidatus Thiodictyon syntrophicum TaxID=1166950 RepID=A0A2K8U8N3_9GAMM|nr:caspase family protein [Candidatus Thiodictyon syntrophicum]AUB81952.1 hypothetical protein THSYN_14035 [Candidatus Thiodictyon syntrophicum]
MATHALIVGINCYDAAAPLYLPAADAQAIAQRLSEFGEFRKISRLPERISPDRSGLCVDPEGRVTAVQLERAICDLFLPIGGGAPDTALLFVAGHGLRKEAGVPESFLAASDTDAARGNWVLSLLWLHRILAASPVPNQIVWLDTCHSGALLDFQQVDPGRGTRCLIAASRPFEYAYEEFARSTAERPRHGVLTGALLRALDPAGTPDGRVTNLTLAERVQRALAAEPQHPLIANSGEPIVLTRAAARSAPVAAASGRCPYKGLAFFQRDNEDPDDFFGRTRLTDELLERLRTGAFLALVGVSGSGKSSVVRAGLLHQLRLGQRVGGSRDWPQVIMVPGADPFVNLAAALIEQTAADRAAAIAVGRCGTAQQLVTLVDGLTADPPGTRLILLIDQFEELFTQSPPAVVAPFLATLLDALDLSQGRLTLILTLRADFYAKCAEQDYSGLARRIQGGQVIVQPMDGTELTQAICAPA